MSLSAFENWINTVQKIHDYAHIKYWHKCLFFAQNVAAIFDNIALYLVAIKNLKRIMCALHSSLQLCLQEANHSPQSSAEVKNEWSYTSTPHISLHGMIRDFAIRYVLMCLRWMSTDIMSLLNDHSLLINFNIDCFSGKQLLG